ncbi:spermatogenesis-associated protein 2-like protein [Excalfactoria chinensis]|uniref:spermatogenesis-associated protein 2-like protein n=1 Tax=Excalfactoria chinensis TaxID=46218 RepID=UPI003B3A8272
MCAGPALRHEYRRGLERERGGPGPDPSFGERLRRRLRDEPGLLPALQDDAGALLARGLRGRPEPGPSLRALSAAFELLERAALNLYLFPWRKEFRTIQTFSGAYVHVLRAALPEAELLHCLGRLGYARLDERRLAVNRPPSGSELAAAACGFLACRLECDILAEVLLRLRPRLPSAEELLDARRVAGDVETCVEMLREAAPGCEDDRELYGDVPVSPEDLYFEGPDSPEDGGERYVSPPALNSKLQRDPAGLQGVQDVLRRNWDACKHSELRQELLPSPGLPKPDPSSSRFFLQQEQREVGSSPPLLCPARLPPGEPPPSSHARDQPPAAPQQLPELPSYQLHSCLRQGTLPAYCCTTCQQLHAGTCAAGLACRSHHRGQELRCERQQRLWLQRTEVDMLLADGTSTRP